MGPGVVFETSMNGVCWCMELKSEDSWEPRRLIDSNVTNARKCLEVKQYKSYMKREHETFMERN